MTDLRITEMSDTDLADLEHLTHSTFLRMDMNRSGWLSTAGRVGIDKARDDWWQYRREVMRRKEEK